MEPLPAAGKMQLIQDLLAPPIYGEDGQVIGYGDPLITKEQALELLEIT